MLFAAAVNVEELDEILPPLVKRPKVARQRRGAGELSIVVLDLVLEPAEVLHGLAFAGRKALDQALTIGFAGIEQLLSMAVRHELAIAGQIWNDHYVNRLSDQRDQQRDPASRKGRGREEAR